MSQLSDVEIAPLGQSSYLKPFSMLFRENGKNINKWYLIEVHDLVSIIIYNISRNVLVLVKQFRPSLYFSHIPHNEKKENEKIDIAKYPAALGMSIELCTGLVDKNIPLIEIAKEEILEETGYSVTLDKIEFVSSFASDIGCSSSLQTLYYCEVKDDMKISSGGGVGNECIETVEMTVPEIREYVSRKNVESPPSSLFGIYWFLVNEAKAEI